MAELQEAREQLLEVLGDLSSKYWTTLSLWYKKKLSKEEFDIQIKQLLGESNINIHNRFLFALLAKCQEMCLNPAAPSKSVSHPCTASIASHRNREQLRRHVRPDKVNFEQRFRPYNPLEGTENVDKVVLTDDSEINLCSYEFTLPDVQAMNGRLFLAAWDVGLESVEDTSSNAAKLVISAVKYHIKDILTACCSRKGGFRLRDGHYKYGLDTSYSKPNIWNGLDSYTSHSILIHQGRAEQMEVDAAVTVASSSPPCAQASISMYELREALQVHCRVIPSHTVYAANMERILLGMWHPSHDEIEQSKLHKLEAKRRQNKLRQQRSLRL